MVENLSVISYKIGMNYIILIFVFVKPCIMKRWVNAKSPIELSGALGRGLFPVST